MAGTVNSRAWLTALASKARTFERQVHRIVAGQRPTEIAEALCLSVKTVSTHKLRIQDKLQLRNTAALIRYGLEQQLDKPEDSGFDRSIA